MNVVPGERNVFYRERIDGLYGTTTFMLSYMSIEIPLDVRLSFNLVFAAAAAARCRGLGS